MNLGSSVLNLDSKYILTATVINNNYIGHNCLTSYAAIQIWIVTHFSTCVS